MGSPDDSHMNKDEPGLEFADEWQEWFRLTPAQRWKETEKLWRFYLSVGGSLDPEPDSQSPFRDAFAPGEVSSHGRPGVRLVRRGGV